jgi:hypothetical protein
MKEAYEEEITASSWTAQLLSLIWQFLQGARPSPLSRGGWRRGSHHSFCLYSRLFRAHALSGCSDGCYNTNRLLALPLQGCWSCCSWHGIHLEAAAGRAL